MCISQLKFYFIIHMHGIIIHLLIHTHTHIHACRCLLEGFTFMSETVVWTSNTLHECMCVYIPTCTYIHTHSYIHTHTCRCLLEGFTFMAETVVWTSNTLRNKLISGIFYLQSRRSWVAKTILAVMDIVILRVILVCVSLHVCVCVCVCVCVRERERA
jgi:hypothetical protein